MVLKSKLQIPIIILFLILGIFGILSSFALKQLKEPPPKISISAWIDRSHVGTNLDISSNLDQIQIQDNPITLVNESTYIISSQVILTVFNCSAPYPMQIEFSQAKWLLYHRDAPGVLLALNRRIVSDVKSEDSFRYETFFLMYGDPRPNNGVFVCKKANDTDTDKRSNFTVFWDDAPANKIFVLSQRNVTVWIEPAQDKIIFPCHIMNPFIQVKLLQGNNIVNQTSQTSQNASTGNETLLESEEWIPIPEPFSSQLTFLPEKGFIFNKKDPLGWLEPGLYKCIAEVSDGDEDEADFVLMNFVATIEPGLLAGFQFETKLTSPATFTQNNKTQRYECCSNSDKPPQLIEFTCVQSCQVILLAFKSAENQKSHIFERWAENAFKVFDIKHNGRCTSIKMNSQGKDRIKLIQCKGDGVSIIKTVAPLSWHNMTRSQDYVTIKPENIALLSPPHPLPVQNETRDNTNKEITYHVYINQTVSFSCQIPKYISDSGIVWVAEMKDKSSFNLPVDTDPILKKLPPSDALIRSLFTSLGSPFEGAKVTFKVTLDFNSVTCYLPYVRSKIWITKTILLDLKEPKPPSIQIPNNESTFFWKVNETDKSLTCKIEGDPNPQVLWMKDDRPTIDAILHKVSTHHDGTSILRISQVTHLTQGLYTCTAINFAGSAQQTFTIYVEDSETAAMTATVFLTLLTIILILIALYLFRKKRFL